MPHRPFTLSLALLTPLLLLLALGAATSVAQTDRSSSPAPADTLTRQREVVVVYGASLPAMQGAPLDELFAYRFDGAVWQQIPFQFDEVDPINSSYVLTGDGRLDPADELAFLAQDAGQPAPAGQWIANPLSTAHPRYELLISDPLHPGEQGFVYVYRSPALAPAFGPGYIDVTTDTIVQLNSVQTTGTSAFSYYLDNAGASAADCHGTDGAFGESGIRVAPFAGQVTIRQQLYFAEPLSQAAGALYQSYAATPLQVAAANQLTCFFADLHPDASHTDPALCDDDVDVVDVQRVGGCWNQPPGTSACPTLLDVDGDLSITAADIAAVAEQWGWVR